MGIEPILLATKNHKIEREVRRVTLNVIKNGHVRSQNTGKSIPLGRGINFSEVQFIGIN